jgi:DNA-binding GntR family transcriptional regulator
MTDAAFAVRRAPPLAVQVTNALRAMLAEPVFEPGARLVEEDLARRLAVSRTPVREALFRLAQLGLVDQRDAGFFVPQLTLRDIHEIFQVRRLLEPQAVADIAANRPDADMPAYLAARDRMVAATTPDEATAANIAFRALWLSRIPNQRMQQVLRQFDDQVIVVRRATLRLPDAPAVATAGVVALVESFATRDAAGARRVMQDFIDSALAWFETAVSTPENARPDPKETP